MIWTQSTMIQLTFLHVPIRIANRICWYLQTSIGFTAPLATPYLCRPNIMEFTLNLMLSYFLRERSILYQRYSQTTEYRDPTKGFKSKSVFILNTIIQDISE